MFENVNMPKRRAFFRHTALIFLAIHKVLPRQIAWSGEKIPCRWTHFQFSNRAWRVRLAGGLRRLGELP